MNRPDSCEECAAPREVCPDCKRPVANQHDEGIHNTGECGCAEARALCWRRWSHDGVCRSLSIYDSDFIDQNNELSQETMGNQGGNDEPERT